MNFFEWLHFKPKYPSRLDELPDYYFEDELKIDKERLKIILEKLEERGFFEES